jgi:hypothetical protein
MGNIKSTCLVSYEKVQQARLTRSILIHTMEETEKTLIQGSLTAEMELKSINELMSKNEFDTSIIVYGRNDHDYDSLMTKQKQLKSLGFRNVFIYLGGMFEWLLLQDVFGANLFPTTVAKVDLLRFAP